MKKYLLGATAAVFALSAMASSANAAALGYGAFVGTWSTQNPSPYAQPSTNAGSVTQWGNNVLAVLNPDPFVISDWHLAGDTAGTWSNTLGPITSTGAMKFTSAGSENGSWEYLGGANDGNPVDMYIALKYATWVSIFFWGNVVAGDTGKFTIDSVVWNANNPPPDLYDGRINPAPNTFVSGACGTETPNNLYFSYNCLGTPGGMSHAIAYWPPGDPVEEVPAPGALALLGLGLLGLGFRRRRA